MEDSGHRTRKEKKETYRWRATGWLQSAWKVKHVPCVGVYKISLVPSSSRILSLQLGSHSDPALKYKTRQRKRGHPTGVIVLGTYRNRPWSSPKLWRSRGCFLLLREYTTPEQKTSLFSSSYRFRRRSQSAKTFVRPEWRGYVALVCDRSVWAHIGSLRSTEQWFEESPLHFIS